METSSLPEAQPFDDEQPPLSRRLLGRAQHLPWWAIFIAALVIGFGVYAFTDDDQREILIWLLNDPQLITEEINNVVYEVETQAVVVKEEYLLADIDGERFKIDKADAISVEQGILECPPAADQDCLSQRGQIVTFLDFRLEEGEEADGFAETIGVATERSESTSSIVPNFDNVALRVTLPDGSQRLIDDESLIIEQGEETDYVLECDRIVDPECEDIVGQFIRFQTPYIERQAILAREDIVIRHIDESVLRTIRPSRLLEPVEGVEQELPCPDIDPDCTPEVATIVRYPERITGTEIEIDGDERTIRVVEQQTISIPRERINDLRVGVVECDASFDPACSDYQGTIVDAEGETFTGRLSNESNITYRIILGDDDTATEFDRREIFTETRSPEGCTAAGIEACEITIQLNSFEVGGRILEDGDPLVLETVPEQTITLTEDEIFNVRKRVPAGCGLNNIRGCDQGIWLTIIVTITAYVSSLLIGLMMGLFRVSSNPILHHFSSFYVELIRGVPLLVLLMYFAFVIGPTISNANIFIISDFYDLATQAEIAVLGQESFLAEAVIGLAIGYSAFMAEVFRAGIESIHRGQMEAARSLGMSYFEAMRHVILPQAIRVVLPPLGNEFIAILKDSALISVLALPDLLQMGRIYASRVFQARPAYTMVAWVYICMTLVLSLGVRWVERRAKLP